MNNASNRIEAYRAMLIIYFICALVVGYCWQFVWFASAYIYRPSVVDLLLLMPVGYAYFHIRKLNKPTQVSEPDKPETAAKCDDPQY